MIDGKFGEIGELIFEVDLIATDGERFPEFYGWNLDIGVKSPNAVYNRGSPGYIMLNYQFPQSDNLCH